MWMGIVRILFTAGSPAPRTALAQKYVLDEGMNGVLGGAGVLRTTLWAS